MRQTLHSDCFEKTKLPDKGDPEDEDTVKKAAQAAFDVAGRLDIVVGTVATGGGTGASNRGGHAFNKLDSVCFLCGSSDHIASRCPDEICVGCLQRGHSLKSCPMARTVRPRPSVAPTFAL